MNMQSLANFDRWNHAVHSVCGRFITQVSNAEKEFVGDIRHQDLGGLNVADICVNASLIKRERGSASRGDDRFYFLVMQRQGVMGISAHHDEQFQLKPGEIALLDSSMAFEMQPQGLVRQLSVHICRDALDRAVSATAKRFGKLDNQSLSGRMLACLLREIAEDGTQQASAGRDGDALQNALLSLLQPGLPMDLDNSTIRPLRRMAEKLIQEALPKALSPTELAAQLNVSVRKLYRQFEMDGETICRYVQRQRLEGSARELADTSETAVSITSIAYKWQFTDSAHFSNAFKRHFGMSPSEYRAAQHQERSRRLLA